MNEKQITIEVTSEEEKLILYAYDNGLKTGYETILSDSSFAIQY